MMASVKENLAIARSLYGFNHSEKPPVLSPTREPFRVKDSLMENLDAIVAVNAVARENIITDLRLSWSAMSPPASGPIPPPRLMAASSRPSPFPLSALEV